MTNQFEQSGKACYNCGYCGVFVWKYPSQVYTHVFCSEGCQHEWQRTKREYDSHDNYETCDECGECFKRKPSHVHDHTFCSQECYFEWESKGNPRGFYLTPEWRQKRTEILKRDGQTCQHCGTEERLEVHHITPISEGGSRLDGDNLTVLCKDCHIDTHR